MTKDKFRGYEIEQENGRFVFSDTREVVADTWESRPCGFCNKFNTVEGHDACLGTLPGVINACCGHGNTKEAYVQYPDGSVSSGKVAVKIQSLLKQCRDEGYE